MPQPTDARQRVSAGRWVWNAVVYPIGFLGIALATVTATKVIPGVDTTPTHQDALDLVLGRFVGMTFYWLPAVISALALLGLMFRFAPAWLHRPGAILTPLLIVGAWIAWLVSTGHKQSHLESVVGVAITVVALVAVGLFTRAPQRGPSGVSVHC